MHVIRIAAAVLGGAALSFVLQGQQPASGAAACTTTFTTSAGSWSTAANWSAGLPTATSYACIPTGSTASLTSTVTVDGVRIDGGLSGAGTLRISDQGAISESELDGTVTDTNVNLLAGTLLVETAGMSGPGTTTVAAGATVRVTNADYYGLLVQGPRQLVVDGTLVADHTTGGLTSVLLNDAGATLTINGTLDLKNGAGIAGTGALVVPQGGLVRAVTVGVTATVDTPFRLAGRVAPTAGVLDVDSVEPIGSSTTGVLATNGGSLVLNQVLVPAGARLSSSGHSGPGWLGVGCW